MQYDALLKWLMIGACRERSSALMESVASSAESDVLEKVLNCIDDFWVVWSCNFIARAALAAANNIAAHACCISETWAVAP